MAHHMNRRAVLGGLAAGAAALPGGVRAAVESARPYRGPNVILIRYGGGVRRRETIDPQYTYSPYLRHVLTERGTFFPDMTIESLEGVVTSHGEGTLYLLTGKYQKYRDIENRFLGARFEATVPTLFEYFRKAYDVPRHEVLLINGEDRPNEEYYTFGNHRLFGVDYRSEVLSLYRYKVWLLRRKLAEGTGTEKERENMQRRLAKLEAYDYRRDKEEAQAPAIEAFWERWRAYYGESGLINARGDRLLTELAARAMRELSPKLLMINYQDTDYVHWGNASHYTRAISIIDRGIERIVETADHLPAYRNTTVFVIVPDCGRDSNPMLSVPYQHHFNTKSAHEIWALVFGPGIARGRLITRPVTQIAVTATVGAVMDFETPYAESPALAEVFL